MVEHRYVINHVHYSRIGVRDTGQCILKISQLEVKSFSSVNHCQLKFKTFVKKEGQCSFAKHEKINLNSKCGSVTYFAVMSEKMV